MVDEAGEAIDVAAEAGTVVEHSVKPSDSRTYDLDERADEHHGDKSADTNHVPKPLPEEKVAEEDCCGDEQDVNNDLSLGKGDVEGAAERYGKSLARHGDGSAADLKRYADGKHDAAEQLDHDLGNKGRADDRRGQPHVDIEQKAEEKSNE